MMVARADKNNQTPKPLFGTPIGPWFRWFAWHPVRTADRGWRWLRPVWRRRYQTKISLSGPVCQWWHNVVTSPGEST